MAGGSDDGTVSLPEEIYARIQERLEATEFTTVSEYVLFVLGEVLRDDVDEGQTFTAEDEAEVKQRLKALGYLR